MNIQSFTGDQISGQYPIISRPELPKNFGNAPPKIPSAQTDDLEKQFLAQIKPAFNNAENTGEVDRLIKRLEKHGFAALIGRCFKNKMSGFNVNYMRSVVVHEGPKVETPKLLAALDCLQKNGEENVTLYRLYQLVNERNLSAF